MPTNEENRQIQKGLFEHVYSTHTHTTTELSAYLDPVKVTLSGLQQSKLVQWLTAKAHCDHELHCTPTSKLYLLHLFKLKLVLRLITLRGRPELVSKLESADILIRCLEFMRTIFIGQGRDTGRRRHVNRWFIHQSSLLAHYVILSQGGRMNRHMPLGSF